MISNTQTVFNAVVASEVGTFGATALNLDMELSVCKHVVGRETHNALKMQKKGKFVVV